MHFAAAWQIADFLSFTLVIWIFEMADEKWGNNILLLSLIKYCIFYLL